MNKIKKNIINYYCATFLKIQYEKIAITIIRKNYILFN